MCVFLCCVCEREGARGCPACNVTSAYEAQDTRFQEYRQAGRLAGCLVGLWVVWVGLVGGLVS